MPTALELSREEWKTYIEAAIQRPPLSGSMPVDQVEREKLLVRIRKAAEVLKGRFGATKVVLFGSLAYPEWFTEDSDVDLVVEGLEGKDYWEAWRVTEEIVGDRLVDFIEMETVGESLRQAVHRSGVEL
jgi:predicted nucleotidyltransferase